MKQLFHQVEESGQRRVLLADEVGLGKTIVARTVISDLTKLRSDNDQQTTILYLCSNADLARQNADKLNGTQFKYRLSELSIYRPTHESGKPVIISASTGTNIALRNKTGRKKERAILFLVCCKAFGIRDDNTDFITFMGGNVKSFDDTVEKIRPLFELHGNDDLVISFAEGLREHYGCDRSTILEEANIYVRNGGRNRKRSQVIGWMLMELVKAGLSNGPKLNLIIMDEFQRFEDVLDDVNEPNSVSHHLLNKSEAPVLLLSATPFKMYTSTWDEGAHHDKQMIRLLRFLYGGEVNGVERVDEITKLLHRYRYQLLDAAANRGDHEERLKTKLKLESLIGHVMVRTERRALSGTLMEPKDSTSTGYVMDVKDIQHYFMLKSSKIEGFDSAIMAYWQSSPYLLSFCDTQYQFKRKFLKDAKHIHKLLAKQQFASLRKHMVLTPEVRNLNTKLTITHPRLRALMKRCFEDQRSVQWLWLPPSKPYWKPGGVFAASDSVSPSKLLVFSNWRFVPRAVASLLSLEAERELFKKWGKRNNEIRAMKISSEEGGTHFTVLYPSLFLADIVSPLEIVAKLTTQKTESISWNKLKTEALRILRRKLKDIGVKITTKGTISPHRVYQWLVRLDALRDMEGTTIALDGMAINLNHESTDENKSLSMWRDRIISELEEGGQLAIPEKGVELLALIALASPATTLLRSMRTHFPDVDSAKIHNLAMSFSMYTLRGYLTKANVYSIIKKTDKRSKYWNDILAYGIHGNIQAMWDEYIAMLSMEDTEPKRVLGTIQKALGMSERGLTADSFSKSGFKQSIPMPIGFCRPYSDDQKEEKAEGKDRVRQAFNSPFWPHVLVTTSVGQEGLDFHRYCRELVHWNLPVNPIDFEQREGRINRYRSLAVRQSVGEEISWLDAFNTSNSKRPWDLLFSAATLRKPEDVKDGDLWPDWVFYGEKENGKSRLIRHVWLFPFSKENMRYQRMRELVVLYRLAFGQPNQEDFLKSLQARVSNSGVNEAELAKRYMIDLAPK